MQYSDNLTLPAEINLCFPRSSVTPPYAAKPTPAARAGSSAEDLAPLAHGSVPPTVQDEYPASMNKPLTTSMARGHCNQP